ncbi:MAG: hypothetical protein Q7R87_04770 [Nanoarchaeota archaeon]|nr:hypothetical protein [Nanoarchaeota archaeon]
MDKISMNRKGDVPTTLVFVGALVLVITALWSFASYDGRIQRSLESADLLFNSEKAIESYIYSNLELFMKESLQENVNNAVGLDDRFKDSAGKHDLRIQNTNLFGLIRNGKFSLSASEGGFVLKIDNVFIKLENDAGKIVRTLNIEMKFDGKGNRI